MMHSEQRENMLMLVWMEWHLEEAKLNSYVTLTMFSRFNMRKDLENSSYTQKHIYIYYTYTNLKAALHVEF